MNTRLRYAVVGWFVCGLLVSACGEPAATSPEAQPADAASADSGATDGALPVVDPSAVAGPVAITGSSTVFPLTAEMAAAFAREGSSADIDVKITGTGAGFERFCSGDGEVDIVNASRAITAEELAACEAQGLTPVGFHIGTDALAVVVNDDNDFVTELSIDQLAQIFSGAVTTWLQVEPGYPDEPIALFSPGTDSGTFDVFVEEVFGGDEQPILNAPGIVLSESDYELAQGIAENPYAIGYFGYAYYNSAQDTLNVVAIDDGSGNAVAPSAETVADGTYPFARPLFIYTSPNIMGEKPQVAAFVNYYLQNVLGVIESVGYFPPSDAALEEAHQAFLDVTR